MKYLWIVLGVVIALPEAAEAIPLAETTVTVPKKRRGRRMTPAVRAKLRVKKLKSLKAMVDELKKWSSDIHYDMKRMYSDSLTNLKRAREAIFRAKGKTPPPYKAPYRMEAQTARASNSTSYPTSKYSVPVVNPDGFYLHVKAHFPPTWVAQRKKVYLKWYIFDHRHLPTAAKYQKRAKAIYYDYYYSKPVSSSAVHYYNHVRGLELPPGRYFVAAVIRASKGAWNRPTQVSLGVFRVAGKNPPGVKVTLPHYRNWYSSYSSILTFAGLKARARRKAIVVSGKITHSQFTKDAEPIYIEVVAESGYRKKVIYRDRKRPKKATIKFKANTKKHGLSPGSYTLRVTAYTEYEKGTRYKYMTGKRTEQKLNVTVP